MEATGEKGYKRGAATGERGRVEALIYDDAGEAAGKTVEKPWLGCSNKITFLSSQVPSTCQF